MPHYGMLHGSLQNDSLVSTALSTATEKLHELVVPWQCEVGSPQQVSNFQALDSESAVEGFVRSGSTSLPPKKRRRTCCPKLPLSLGIRSPRRFRKQSEAAYLDGVENNRERADAPVSPVWLQRPPQTSPELASFLAQIRARLILIERRLYYLTNEKQALLSCLWSISKPETATAFPATRTGPVPKGDTGDEPSRIQVERTCVRLPLTPLEGARPRAFPRVRTTLPTPATEHAQLACPALERTVFSQQSRATLSLWSLTQLTDFGDCVSHGQTTDTQTAVLVGEDDCHDSAQLSETRPTPGSAAESDGPSSTGQSKNGSPLLTQADYSAPGSAIVNSKEKRSARLPVTAFSLSSDFTELEIVDRNGLRSPMELGNLSETLLPLFEDEHEFQQHWDSLSDEGLRKWLRFFGLKATSSTPSRAVMLEELNSILHYIYRENRAVPPMPGVDTSEASPSSHEFAPPGSKLCG